MSDLQCTQCRDRETSSVEFCSSCSKAISPGATPEHIASAERAGAKANPSGRCSECEAAGVGTGRFCVNCGISLPPGDAPKVPPPPPVPHTAGAPEPSMDAHTLPQAPPSDDEQVRIAQAGRNTANRALGLGIAGLFISILGPFALFLGLRSRKHGGGRSVAAIILGALGTVALLGAALMAVSVLSGGTNGAGVVGVLDMLGGHKEREIVERIHLSDDQKELIELYGYPNTFIVVVDDHGMRGEFWDYYECTGNEPFLREHFEPRRLHFENGVFIASAPIVADSVGAFFDYRPTEFDLTADETQIRQIMGRPTEKRELNMAEYGSLTVLNYRNEIMFMFRDDKPFGVMTFRQNGGPQETVP